MATSSTRDAAAAVDVNAQPGVHRLPVRVLLCSPELPPLHTGHAAVLERMFRQIHPDDYQLVAFSTRELIPDIAGRSLPARTHMFGANWPPYVRDDYRLRGVRIVRTFLQEAAARARILADLVRTEQCGAILVTSSNTPDPLAALAAARMARVPLVVYMLDNWRHLMALSGRLLGEVASHLQPRVLAGARLVMAPNSSVAGDILRDHGRRSVVVGIPLPDPALLNEPEPLAWPRTGDELRLVFTGQVYEAHFDAMRRLLAALESERLPRAALHVYTSQSPEAIEGHGMTGKIVVHQHVPPPHINAVQREADILFLPLGFVSVYPDIVRTASPTKTGEYLASGTPVLVHAPPDSYPAAAARRHGFAALVDRPSVDALVEAILRIASDPDYRRQIVSAARRAAFTLHGPEATTELFVRSLQRALVADGVSPR